MGAMETSTVALHDGDLRGHTCDRGHLYLSTAFMSGAVQLPPVNINRIQVCSTYHIRGTQLISVGLEPSRPCGEKRAEGK